MEPSFEALPWPADSILQAAYGVRDSAVKENAGLGAGLIGVRAPAMLSPPPTAMRSPRLDDAFVLAAHLHGDDVRKGTSVPYLAHLLGVCARVLVDGGDEDEAIAALLHDALEDHPEEISRADLAARFGPRVTALVEACTDTPPDWSGGRKPPWRQRKEAYLAHVRSALPDTLRVSLADKVDNARAILADHRAIGDAVWERFSAGRDEQLWYYRELVAAYRVAGVTSPMLDELARVVAALGAAVSRR
jgi:(p)ppGpp synthase/HD superfamily hydrolase